MKKGKGQKMRKRKDQKMEIKEKEYENYAEIKIASPEELLDCGVNHYKKYDSHVEKYMRIGFNIGRFNGWKEIAPAWLKEFRKKRERLQYHYNNVIRYRMD